jgi:3-hydroxyacyl-[acyl-carrier-protein] dehydratase
VPVPVRELLPHRPPILLVDRVLTALPGMVVTERTVRPDDPCYRHCPSTVDIWRCAYPESLILESLAQGGAVLFMLDREPGGTLVLGAVRQVRVHAPVFPGETMRHRVEVEHSGTNTSIVSGTTWVGDRLCLSVGRLVAAVRGARPAELALSG